MLCQHSLLTDLSGEQCHKSPRVLNVINGRGVLHLDWITHLEAVASAFHLDNVTMLICKQVLKWNSTNLMQNLKSWPLEKDYLPYRILCASVCEIKKKKYEPWRLKWGLNELIFVKALKIVPGTWQYYINSITQRGIIIIINNNNNNKRTPASISSKNTGVTKGHMHCSLISQCPIMFHTTLNCPKEYDFKLP